MADSFVLRTAANDFLVVSSFSPAATICPRLEDYLIADEVEVRDETSSWQAIDLFGPRAETIVAAAFGSTPQPDSYLAAADALVFRGRFSKDPNFMILAPPRVAVEWLSRILAAGASAVDAEVIAAERIASGIPAVPADIGAGDLPNEGGLEVSAISFTKGCYLGQEVMARLKNLGQVRRRLHVVEGFDSPPAPATEVFQNGMRVGTFRSVARRGDGFVAFAMLSLINLDPKADLSLSPDSPAAIRVIAPV